MSEATVTPEPVILTGASGKQYELGATIGSWGTHPQSECDAEDAGSYYGPDGTFVCRCVVCGRCGKHTGNSHQGHYWAICQAWLKQGKGLSGSKREFHFCCPDNCELEAVAS